MRGDRDRDRGGNGGDDEARKAAEQKVNEAMIVTPLVPGFGEPDQDLMLEPLLGFGSAAEMMAVEVTPKDQQDAEENLRRSDRNGDGVLSGDEISSRWSGNPMDFDRNGDKKLSLNELAIRTARKRVVESSPAVKAVASKSDGKKDSRRDDPKAQEPKDLYNGRKSYLTNVAKLPEGLPGWFAARDRNGDRQVEMSEYADSWNNAVIAEFNQFDRSGDGVVTVQECMTAVESGASASSVASTPAPSPSTPPASSSTPSSSTPSSLTAAPSPTTVATTSAAAPSGGSILPVVEDEKLIKYAQKIIGRYDTNGDGALTASEWQTMLVNPQAADANKDGRVTIPEYAASMASRSAR